MSLMRYAWRNIWRNGKRTAITIVAVGLNTAVLIASYALMEGMFVDMVHRTTRLVVGDAQVHLKGYRLDRSIYKDIPYPLPILETAKRAGIQAAARSYGFGLVSSGSKSAGASFWGVDPEVERKAFELSSQMFQGRYLSATPAGEVVLGRKLAKSLNLQVGSEMVAVVQAADGSLGNELYQLVGILKSAGEEIDRSAAIVHRDDFDRLFVAEGRIHEIALNAWGRLSSEQVVQAVAGVASDAEVKTWRELMPQLANMLDLFDAGIWIFGLIFFLAAALGVMNTMLMATYERIQEFGVMKAIGATPWRIVTEVTAEAFVMALVSTIAGVAVGVAASVYFESVGIDLRAFGAGETSFTGIAFDPLWHATVNPKVVFMPVLVMWIVCVIASLYPAAKAARLDPVRALTHV